tara:strand:- start:36818 stop:38071 length:1254 start_codon:yes stop_codon:yes gene_type:complete
MTVYKPGGLNPEVTRHGADLYEYEADRFNFLAVNRMNQTMVGSHTRDTNAGVIEYKAIVLTSAPPPGENEPRTDGAVRYKFKIRIPELHSALTDPCTSLAEFPGAVEDLPIEVQDAIDKHPYAYSYATVQQNENVRGAGQAVMQPPRPSVGDIVWVTYEKSPSGGRQGSPNYKAMFRPSAISSEVFGNAANNLRNGCDTMAELFGSGDTTSVGDHRTGASSNAPTNRAPPIPRSPAERATLANNYDNDASLPNKQQHAPLLAGLHPDFRPVVKSFLYRCWSEKTIKFRLNSSFRDTSDQQRLRREWIARGKTDPEPSAGWSYHSNGWALDFNPTLSSGKMLMSHTNKNEWIDSGLVAIAEQEGMRWGGHWRNYDPIHVDWGATHSKETGKSFYDAASAANTDPNDYTFADYRNSAQV